MTKARLSNGDDGDGVDVNNRHDNNINDDTPSVFPPLAKGLATQVMVLLVVIMIPC